MIISVDCETAGLDATKFVAGCVRKGKKHKLFYEKKEMWNYILDLGKSESKRGKVLSVYAHNHEFDFYAYADLADKNIRFFSTRQPFIVAYIDDIVKTKQFNSKNDVDMWEHLNEKYRNRIEIVKRTENDDGSVDVEYKSWHEIIKFLDSYSLYKMSLKDLGKIINMEKMELSDKFMTGNESVATLRKMIETNENGMQDYLKRDTDIVQTSVNLMRDKLKDDGVIIRRLMSISQIAIAYVINQLKLSPVLTEKNFWDNKRKGIIYKTKYPEQLHSAYRGGRVEAFKTGAYNNVVHLDINSLYPYAVCNMTVPDITSERYIVEPLKQMNINQVLDRPGVCRCIMQNNSNNIGLLPVRLDTSSYVPKKGKAVLGTWTTWEIGEALKNGYELIYMEWCVIYEKDLPENPFKAVYQELYKKRKSSDIPFDDFYYKAIMNHSIGKFAQNKPETEYLIDSVEKYSEYLDMQYKAMQGIGTNYLYKKEIITDYKKTYYCPIVPILVNAWSRVYLYNLLKRVEPDKLLYCDTDSVMYQGSLRLFENQIGHELGKLKVLANNGRCVIYARKTYAINENVKVSGIHKKDLNMSKFLSGIVSSKRMVTIKNAKDLSKVGRFVDEVQDLKCRLDNYEHQVSLLENQKIYIDKDIYNLQKYLIYLKKLRL